MVRVGCFEKIVGRLKTMNGGNGNGSTAVAELITVTNSSELSETQKTTKAKSKSRKTSVKVPKLVIDAGSSNTKYYFEKEFGRFSSQFKKFDTGVAPENTLGVMTLGDSWYAFGDSVTSFPMGETEYGYENDNKIKSLAVWVIAALTDHEYYLETLIRKDKSNKTINFNLDITLLTLSAHRLDEIKGLLKEISFSYSGRKFKVTIKNIECLPEGFGAAKFAFDMINPTVKAKNRKRSKGLIEFNILDLGGGTLTRTPYICKGKISAGKQVASSGCGLQVIRKLLATKAPTMVDRGATCFFNHGLMQAIETAELNEDKSFKCEYIDGREKIQLGEVLYACLHDWVSEIESVRTILQEVALLTRRGQKVFLTGGGFEISPIEKYVRDFINNNEMVETLPDPGQINITGLK